MKLYSPKITPRLLYMANWAGNYLFGNPMTVISSLESLQEDDCIINYSESALPFPAFQIVPCGLLGEATTRPLTVGVMVKGQSILLFPGKGILGFDLLSAAFYLLSRYEEYLSHEKDEYGRFAHTGSLAYKHGFLNRPLADEWMKAFREKLLAFFPSAVFVPREAGFLPTYDVDIAWSYKNKGLIRTLAGMTKDMVTGRAQNLRGRIAVLTGKKNDPFDVFGELDDLHRQFQLAPIYFLLLAGRPAGYDKNIPPSNRENQALLRRIASLYKTGIHLSWKASVNKKAMEQEMATYKSITGERPSANRMHYIHFQLPGTYEQLLALGITEDYSMGYGSINGFRAGTCTPFTWFNLSTDSPTALTLFPFCYMEANSIFEQKDDPATGLSEMQYYYNFIKNHGGLFISIFHNHLVGLSKTGRNWMSMYRCFLEKNCPADPAIQPGEKRRHLPTDD